MEVVKKLWAARAWRLKSTVAAILAVWMMLTAGLQLVGAVGEDENGLVANDLGLEVRSAILMDAKSGQLLFEVNAEVPLPPASMAKMMTEYIVLEEIKSGNLSWDDTIVVRNNAATTTRQGSHIFLAEGDRHTVEELFIAMAVGSANDASIALAEHISGTEEAFSQRMNETARELGMETAHFINATGLSREDLSPQYQPSTIDGETLMSAKDAAQLAYHILSKHPEILEYSSIPSYKFRERDNAPMINYNWMLENHKDTPSFRPYVYEGLDGMKTGHTSVAGYCFTGTAERNGMRLIGVVMGTDSQFGRFLETAKLLDYGFNNFEAATLVSPKSVVESFETVNVKKGKAKSVPVVTAEDVTFLVKKGSNPIAEVTESFIQPADELVAPIAAGTVVGNVTFTYTDGEGKALEKTVNLVTTEEVDRASWWRLMFRAIGEFFADLFNGIKDLF